MSKTVPSQSFIIEIEQNVLGSCLLETESFVKCSPLLSVENFIEPIHQEIFFNIEKAYDTYKSTTLPVVIRFVTEEQDNALRQKSGISLKEYVTRLTTSAVATSAGMQDMAKAVVEQWARLRLAEEAENIASAARDPLANAGNLISTAFRSFDQIMQKSRKGITRNSRATLGAAIEQAFRSAQEARERGSGLTGITWGLTDLNRLTGGIQHRDLTLIGARPSMGKAQPLSAKARTPDGWNIIGNLRVGDRICSVDGSENFVTGIFPQGKKEIFKITFSDGRSTRCCNDHLWKIYHREWKEPRILTTARLRSMLTRYRYQKRLWIDMPVADGNPVNLPLDPWLTGAHIGKGSFQTDLKLKEKFIPEQYMNAGHEQRLQLLRGILDTSGKCLKTGKIIYRATSERLARDIAELARSLGAWCSMRKNYRLSYVYEDGKRTGMTAWNLCISHPSREIFFNDPHKKERAKVPVTAKKPTLISIEPDGFEEAMCISVSHPSQLYVTDDYVVTHNTTFATSVARAVAKSGKGVGIISLEMDKEKVSARMASDIAYDWNVKVPYVDIIRGNIEKEELDSVISACRDVHRMPVMIDDQAGVTISEIKAKLEAMILDSEKAGMDFSVLVIDHLGLIRASNRYSGNRNNEIAEMTAAMKSMAREYDIAVVLLSQLNRELDKRNDKRPQLSDLRDSGAIEQDADTIMFLHRESYYLKRQKGGTLEEQAERTGKLADCENLMEIIVAKQRNGPIDTVNVWADMACAAVRNGQGRFM